MVVEESRKKEHCCPECGRKGMILFSVKAFTTYRGSCSCGWSSGRYENYQDVEKLMPYQFPAENK